MSIRKFRSSLISFSRGPDTPTVSSVYNFLHMPWCEVFDGNSHGYDLMQALTFHVPLISKCHVSCYKQRNLSCATNASAGGLCGENSHIPYRVSRQSFPITNFQSRKRNILLKIFFGKMFIMSLEMQLSWNILMKYNIVMKHFHKVHNVHIKEYGK